MTGRVGGMPLFLLACMLLTLLTLGGCGQKLTQQHVQTQQDRAEQAFIRDPKAVMPDWYRSRLEVKATITKGTIFTSDEVNLSHWSYPLQYAVVALFIGCLLSSLVMSGSGQSTGFGEAIIGLSVMGFLGAGALAFISWLGVKIIWPAGYYLPWHFAMTLGIGTTFALATLFFLVLLVGAFAKSPGVSRSNGGRPAGQQLALTSETEPQISPELVADAIAAKRGQLFSTVRTEVHSALLAMSPSESLTLRLLSGEREVQRIAPAATAEYARALIAFTQSKPFKGYEVDSAVTPVTLAAITNAVQRFYGSEEISSAIAASISGQIEASGVLRRELNATAKENAAWLKKEATTALHENTAHSIAGQAIDATTDAIGQLLHTTAGHNIMLTLGKVMATTGGKAILLGGLKAAVINIMATTAAKTMIINLVRKVGIGVLIKTAIGKVIIAALAAVGVGAPLWAILLPIIAAFLVYEYNHFPAKLAEKIPTEVETVFSGHFRSLNKSVSETIVAEVLKRAVETITEIHTGTQKAGDVR